MSQALYRKWRPAAFNELVGQEHVTTTLRNAIAGGRVSHAYLFAGPRGTGKTSAARLLAKGVNCLAPEAADRPCNACAMCQAVNEGRLLDLIEIDAASNTGVDDVRELRDKINFSPSEGQFKIYIIDEVHMLSTAAFNALLKTLEEPPAHAIFVLATTEAHKVPATVSSRCQCFTFRRLATATIAERLQTMCAREGIAVETAALGLIARHATGSLRDAISLLDQLVVDPHTPVTLAQAQDLLGAAGSEAVVALVDAWLANQPARGLAVIAAALDSGTDPRQFARQVVDHLRNLLLFRLSGAETVDVPPEMLAVLQRQATAVELRALLAALKRWQSVTHELRAGWQPQLPLELAFVDTLVAPDGGKRDGGGGARETTARVAEAPAQPARSTTPAAPATAAPAATTSTPARPQTPAPRAARPAPASAAPDAGAAQAGPSLQEVATRWSDVLAGVRARNRNAVAVVREGTPVAVDGHTLVLVFEHSFHKERVTEDKVRLVVEETLEQLFGVALRLRCVLHGDAVTPGAAGGASDDELVEWARNELGAESGNA
jgi:DNA polymerase-3 subunit gamma/tau